MWEQAENLERFAANFSSAFWRALVSFPRPIAGLVSREVLVETFEAGGDAAEMQPRRSRDAAEMRPRCGRAAADIKLERSG